ncbi:protein DpdG [Bradyrhizobium ottawaense]|uniref:protein DpdG n=1 Tax=Bradyrhizobium ottawaense TaxID=931866 RepID=UPI003832CA9F
MPSDGLFNVLIVLTRTLVRLGPKSRSELLKACGAELDAVDPKHLNQSLMRWTELGLFAAEDGVIALCEPYRSLLWNADIAEARLPKVVRGIALAPDNNARFWDAEENRSADFSRGLSWILAQDVYALDTSSHQRVAALESTQVADHAKRMLQNDTRWNGLRTWMLYLGFARGGAQVTIDPTEAVRDVLPSIFGQDETLLAPIFVERAANALPVLDGGAYRLKIEEVLKDSSWTRPGEGHLSTAFSRAIQRLDREGLIAAEKKSDSEDGIMLMGVDQRPWRSMTHIRRIQAKKRK